MKTFILILALMIHGVFVSAQTKEIYFGTSLSKYYWVNSTDISNGLNYYPGGQIGFMWGTKEKNIFGKAKFFQPHICLEYNYFGSLYSTRAENNSTQLLMEAHNVRLSLPIRLRIRTIASGKVRFFGTVEPGANLMVHSRNASNNFNFKPDPFHLFVNAGLGSSIHFDRSTVKKSRYYFSALTFNAGKHIPITSLKFFSAKSGILDQFNFNVGFRFSYMKASKNKFRLF